MRVLLFTESKSISEVQYDGDNRMETELEESSCVINAIDPVSSQRCLKLLINNDFPAISLDIWTSYFMKHR
jgi:hypothetical protein